MFSISEKRSAAKEQKSVKIAEIIKASAKRPHKSKLLKEQTGAVLSYACYINIFDCRTTFLSLY